MRNLQFYLSTSLAGLCVVLSLWLVVSGIANQKLQDELSVQQEQLRTQEDQIKAGNVISQQIGPNILRDMAMVSVEDPKMKELLTKHGYTVNVEASPAPKGAAATPATR